MELDEKALESVALPNEVMRGEHGHFLPGLAPKSPGRPRKGFTYLDRLAAKLDQYGDSAAEAMIAQALKGNVRAHEYLRDTLIGKPADKLIHADAADPGIMLLMQIAEMMGLQVVKPAEVPLQLAEAPAEVGIPVSEGD